MGNQFSSGGTRNGKTSGSSLGGEMSIGQRSDPDYVAPTDDLKADFLKRMGRTPEEHSRLMEYKKKKYEADLKARGVTT